MSFAEELSRSKWGFSVGAFIANQDMKTAFAADIEELRLVLDFEDDLGLRASQSVARIGGFYDFDERHRLDFDVFDLSQAATATLTREFQWGDTVFPVAAKVSTQLDLGIYKVSYAYHPVRHENYRLGIMGGLYVADIAMQLNLTESDNQERGAVTAPLPVLGLHGEYYVSDRWRLNASAEWFGLDVDDYSGTLTDVLLTADYRFSEHAAIGAGYNSTRIRVDTIDGPLRADLFWDYSGIIGYLRFTF